MHVLGHLLESQKEHAAVLIELISKIDVTQRKMFEGNGEEHEHEHGHEHAGHKH